MQAKSVQAHGQTRRNLQRPLLLIKQRFKPNLVFKACFCDLFQLTENSKELNVTLERWVNGRPLNSWVKRRSK